MTEKELRKQLRELAQEMWDQSAEDFYVGDDDKKMVRAYMLLESAHRITRLLIDDEQPDPLKEHHPEVAKWYEKHGEKPSEIPVTSSEGVHTCYEGCTHPAHEGVPVPPIGSEPMDEDDATPDVPPGYWERLQASLAKAKPLPPDVPLADPDDAHTERPAKEDVDAAVRHITSLPTFVAGEVGQVWNHYVSAHPDHKTCRLTAPRKRMIQARLKEGTVQELKDAITGFHLSPWHTGANPENKTYLNFELMMRDRGQVEKGLGCLRDARQPGKATGPTEAEIAAQEAEIRATVDAALAKPIPAPEAPPAPEKEEVEFL